MCIRREKKRKEKAGRKGGKEKKRKRKKMLKHIQVKESTTKGQRCFLYYCKTQSRVQEIVVTG